MLGATFTTVFAIGTSLRRLGILPLADERNIDVPCRKIPERTKVTDVQHRSRTNVSMALISLTPRVIGGVWKAS